MKKLKKIDELWTFENAFFMKWNAKNSTKYNGHEREIRREHTLREKK